MNRVPGLESNDARWQAQERALTGVSSDAGDALLRHALRTLPSSLPPTDFAAGVAHAAMQVRARNAKADRSDQILMKLLGAAMAGSAVICAFVYGNAIATTAVSLLGENALQWAGLGGLCVAVSVLPWAGVLAHTRRVGHGG
ncbi:hypothetical protein [Luteimonas sp. 3794]|uniref:hypothetical protein n=1 Tax=Luteimonas sp. 3794 TaxID=2817730 RepID=UPI0028675D03|nr:hypothetical protein [Luteimonas sp. 3794]MDR6993233.1 hypothetical protein [Luteimonas sp. 3794]